MNARTPTSTLNPPLIAPVTVPAIVAFSAKAFSSDDQSVGRSIFAAGKLVVTFRVAALDGHQQLIAWFHGFARALKGGQRQNAFGLEADVEENRLARDGNYRTLAAFAFFSLVRVTLFILRKKVVERLIGIGGLRFRNAWIRHEKFEYCGIIRAVGAKPGPDTELVEVPPVPAG